MRRSRLVLFALLLLAPTAPSPGMDPPGPAPVQATSASARAPEEPVDPSREAFQTFIRYLREHFDDIHDVSMRFHMTDPAQNGMMVIQMTWTDGRIEAATVVENETNEAEAEAILEVLRRWEIAELTGPVTFLVPIRFRIVGSDDPTYPDKGILTGSVTGPDGTAVDGAQIELIPGSDSQEPIRARANREGVYVRTLIPPGTWDVVCSAEGFRTSRIAGVTFEKGGHRIVRFYLKPTQTTP